MPIKRGPDHEDRRARRGTLLGQFQDRITFLPRLDAQQGQVMAQVDRHQLRIFAAQRGRGDFELPIGTSTTCPAVITRPLRVGDPAGAVQMAVDQDLDRGRLGLFVIFWPASSSPFAQRCQGGQKNPSGKKEYTMTETKCDGHKTIPAQKRRKHRWIDYNSRPAECKIRWPSAAANSPDSAPARE